MRAFGSLAQRPTKLTKATKSGLSISGFAADADVGRQADVGVSSCNPSKRLTKLFFVCFVNFVGFVKRAEGANVSTVVSSYRRLVVNAAEGRNPPKAA